MTTGDMIRELRRLEEVHRDDFVGTGETNWASMCHDVANRLEELLKAQEPRVMTLEEVRLLQDGAVVWIEDNDKVDVIPAIVNHIWNNLPNMASFTAAYAREVKADMLWYGVKWRCWTSSPSDAQREATPWET